MWPRARPGTGSRAGASQIDGKAGWQYGQHPVRYRSDGRHAARRMRIRPAPTGSARAPVKAPALAVLSAVAFAAALPSDIARYGIPALGLVALVPLYAAFCVAPRMRTAVWSGALFGALSTALSNYWLANFGDFAFWTLGGPVVGYAAYNAVLGAVVYKLMQQPVRLRPVLFAAAWTGYELLKSSGYLAYPWGLAAYSFGDVLVVQQIADITGAYGLSFLVVYANAALAELSLGAARLRSARARTLAIGAPIVGAAPVAEATRHALAALLLFAVAAGYGHARLAERPEPVDSVRAVLVQPNIDPWQFGNLAETLTTLQRLSEEALDAGDHDLLVWSETSLSIPYREYRGSYYNRNPSHQPFTEFLSGLAVPLLTGSPYIRNGPTERIWNAVILIEPDTGEIVERYGKRHLVPFAEHVPLWEVEPVRLFFQNVVGLGAVWSPGDERVVFEVPTRRGSTIAAVSISFEGAFASLARDHTRDGAHLLINMTNNSWSRTESAQYQQFVVTRYRAIEARRPLIISTVSGLTALVDRDGRKLASLPMFEEETLAVEAPIYESRSRTVYHRAGDSFAWAMIALTAASLLGSAATRRRRTA